MSTIDGILAESHDRGLIRKFLKGAAFLAPKSVDLPEKLVDADGIIDVKADGWIPLGLVTEDGYNLEEETNEDEIRSHSYGSPTRTDVTEVVRSVTVELQESYRRDLVEFLNGADYSAVTMDEHGNVTYNVPDLPQHAEWRLLILGADGPADDLWVMGWGFGAVKISSRDGKQLATEGAITNSVTLKVFTDPEVGVPVKELVGGSGVLAKAEALGFTAPVGG